MVSSSGSFRRSTLRFGWSSSKHGWLLTAAARTRFTPERARGSWSPAIRPIRNATRRSAIHLCQPATTLDMSERSTELFRAEALSYHDDGHRGGGDVLRISPERIPAAYRLLL